MSSDFKPLVSIIIPVFNGSDYLQKAIDSALAQTYKNIEIIVVNDGSNDDGKTEGIISSYRDKVVYIKKDNGGVSSALNTGIRAMKGDYFSWLSHDDEYAPNKVLHQIEALGEYSDRHSLCLCETQAIDRNSACFKRTKKTGFVRNNKYTWSESLITMLKKGAFNGCAFLIPKVAFIECGFFDERIRYCQDALMWSLLFLNKYDLVFIDSKDALNRIHDNQLSRKGMDLFIVESNLCNEILLSQYLELSTKKYNFIFYYACRNALNNLPEIANEVLHAGREKKIINIIQMLIIKMMLIYGKVRPIIRRAYYRFFRRVTTQ